jgi:hypothetical protein
VWQDGLLETAGCSIHGHTFPSNRRAAAWHCYQVRLTLLRFYSRLFATSQ